MEDNVEADKDDNDDETTQHPFAIEGPPFLGGPEDLSVLSSNATHVAVPLWYNANIVSVFMWSEKRKLIGLSGRECV